MQERLPYFREESSDVLVPRRCPNRPGPKHQKF
jgi:hypothetical protein